MNLFTVNHHPHGFLNDEGKCKQCAIRERRVDMPSVISQINLDMLTAVAWEDGMWIVHFGDIHYRVHDEEKMLALEKALELTRPKVDE